MEFLTNLSVSISGFDVLFYIPAVYLVIVGIYSLIQCYFGYPIFRVMLVIQGVIVGAALGWLLGILLASGVGFIPFAIFFGILGGILANKLHKFGVFIYFFLLFGLIVAGIAFLSSNGNWSVAAIGIPAGIIGGIIGVVLEKQIIIFSSAICYGALAGFSFGMIAKQLWLCIVLTVLFAITGILAQNAMTKKKSKNNVQQAVPANAVYQNPAPANYSQPVMNPFLCLNCHNPLNAGAIFCTKCGRTIPAEQRSIIDAASVYSTSMTPQPAPVAPVNAAPTAQPAPVAPVNAAPTAQPAPVAPVNAAPTAQPAPVGPVNAVSTTKPEAATIIFAASKAEPVYEEPVTEPAPVEPEEPATELEPFDSAYEEPTTELEPVAPVNLAPTPQPAPVAPVYAAPTPQPAPVAPVYAAPTPQPAPVAPVYAAPTPQSAPVAPVYATPTATPVTLEKVNNAPAFCTSCGAKLEFPVARFCGVCGSKIEW